MTDPVVSIEPTELAVEPGGQTRLTITVSNPGTIVENYRIEVLAEHADAGPDAWSQCFPDELSVYPREKGEATVVLSPPADAVSGRQPFAVKVSSTVPPHASAVAEGDVDVGPKYGLQAAITPVTSSGRWRGHHLITYTNWGNAPVRLRLAVRDPDAKLGFLLQPQDVSLPIGGRASVRLAVRTRKPFLRGPQQRLPFEVAAEPDEPGAPAMPPPAVALPSDPRRPVLSAAFNQKPIVSKLAVAAGAVAALAAAAAVVLALRIPKPHHPAPAVGLPLPPGQVAAKLADPATIEITWKDGQNFAHQVSIQSKGVTTDIAEVKPGVGVFAAKGLKPSTKYCFVVRTERDKDHLSAPVLTCGTTPKPKPSGSGSGSGSAGQSSAAAGSSGAPSSSGAASGTPPPPGSFVVLIVRSLTETGTATDAVGVYGEALGLGYQPKGTIFTGDYQSVSPPNLPPLKHPYYGAYKGPYPNADAALNEQPTCSEKLSDPTTHTAKLICLAVQLGPKK